MGHLGETLGGERGLRQGDPISPYLFIMVAKVFGRAFKRKWEGGIIKGIKPTSTLPPKVIQKFVDDSFLSGESSVGEARVWKSVSDIYVVNAGQKINFDKSKVFFFNPPPDVQ